MHHTFGYTLSYNSTAETDITALQDGILTIQNGHLLPQQQMQVWAATAYGTNNQRVRIQSASLLQVTTPFIRPLVGGLVGSSLKYSADYRRNPITLQPLEEVSVLATNNAGAGQRVTVGLHLGAGAPGPSPAGPILALRGTGTTTVTANVWTQCPITWQNNLPNGTYAVIGMEWLSATPQFGRLIFPGQNWRPGAPGVVNDTDISDPLFRLGLLGVWGTFNTTTLPVLEVLCNAADTAQEVYLDIVRIG